MRTAATTYQDIEKDGLYPIYMIWPTGDVQSYSEDMVRVRSGQLNNWPWDDWPKLESWQTISTSLVRPASDLLRGLASTPAAWGTSFLEFYRTGFGFGRDEYMMKRDWQLHVSNGQPIRTGKRVEIEPNQNLYFRPWELASDGDERAPNGEPEADFGTVTTENDWGSSVYHGMTAPVRALTTAPMVGFGEAGWRNMVRRTRTSVRSAAEIPYEFARGSREIRYR